MTKRIMVLISLLVGILAAVSYAAGQETLQEDVSAKLIRLHVLANSDSDEDQQLKLLVRDAVLSTAETCTEGASSREEAQQRLLDAIPRLEQAAEAVVQSEGHGEAVTAALSMEQYPRRQYDTFALPAGEYLSLRVIIGEGAGQNWWCVVYPPLCTAATTEEFFSSAEEADFTSREIQYLTEEPGETVVRFWLVERLRALFA